MGELDALDQRAAWRAVTTTVLDELRDTLSDREIATAERRLARMIEGAGTIDSWSPRQDERSRFERLERELDRLGLAIVRVR